MAQTPQFDTVELKTMAVPYWRARRPADEDSPVIVDGLNVVSTLGGRLLKRFGTADMVIGNPQYIAACSGRIDRMFSLEVTEAPHARFILASVYNRQTGRWSLKYICLNRPGSTPPAWQDVPGNLNGINQSTAPHEAVAVRSRLYVRGVPDPTTGAKFSGVVLSPSSADPYALQTDLWGLPDPEEPARIRGAMTRLTQNCSATDTTLYVESTSQFPNSPFSIVVGFEEMLVTAKTSNTLTVQRARNGTQATEHAAYTVVLWRNFIASPSDVSAVVGWIYSYSYKSRTGHVGSRAPIADEPIGMPSATGPLRALCPVVRIPAHPDPQLVPSIVVWRTTDGGGTFYKVGEVDNPGSGHVEFTDSNGAGGVFYMPMLDDDLSAQEAAPSTVSNSPPPPVSAPKVVGVDNPEPSSPIALYANRIWYAINNVLFFSSLEENFSGVPEESFPSGATGNYFRTAEPIVSLQAASDYLAVITTKNVYQLIGTTRETFSLRLLLSNVGMHPRFPHAVTAYRDTIYFMNSATQIMAVRGESTRIISYPNFADFEGTSPVEYDVEIHPFGFRDSDILMVFFGHKYGWKKISENPETYASHPTQSAYEFNLSDVLRIDFWNPPWDIPALCAVRSRTRVLDMEFLVLANYAYDTDSSVLVTLSPHSGGDLLPDGSVRPFRCYFTLSPIRAPAGNHLNPLRVPTQYPILSHVTLVWRVMLPTSLPGWSALSTYVEPRMFYSLEEIPNPTEPIPFGSYGKPGGWQPGWQFDWGVAPSFTQANFPLTRPYHKREPQTFVEGVHWIDDSARRVSLRVDLPESYSRMEIITLHVSWLPTYGI